MACIFHLILVGISFSSILFITNGGGAKGSFTERKNSTKRDKLFADDPLSNLSFCFMDNPENYFGSVGPQNNNNNPMPQAQLI